MSYIRQGYSVPHEVITLRSFGGLNRMESAMPGEAGGMKNLSSDKYPYLSPVKYQKENPFSDSNIDFGKVRAIAPPREESAEIGFCGVIGKDFFYNGEKKSMKVSAVYENGSFKYGMEIPDDGEIQLLWANRILIIHGWNCAKRQPYIYYYDTDDYGTYDDYVKSYEYKKPSYTTSYTMTVNEGGSAVISHSFEVAGKYEGGYFDFNIGDSVFIDGYMTYSDSRWNDFPKTAITTAVVTNYTETLESQYNGKEKWNITLVLALYNNKNENPVQNAGSIKVYHIYRKIPYMSRLDVHKGRLWGANPNGEYVYGSALGDLFNFNVFDGLNDDSVFLESSTQGGYRGVISCGDSLAIFKENEIEVMYGELPHEFAIGRRYPGCGCIDIASCVVVEGILYYLNDKGVYGYNGGKPKNISEALDKKYTGGYGFTDGTKYYISLKDADGVFETLAYTPRYGMWHRMDASEVKNAFIMNKKLYILKNGDFTELGSGDEKVSWYMESTKLFSDEYYLEGVCDFFISGKLDENCELRLYTSVDDGEWKYAGKISGREKKRIYRLPVRLKEGYYRRFRLEGEGGFIIYGIRAVVADGGQIYSNERIKE